MRKPKRKLYVVDEKFVEVFNSVEIFADNGRGYCPYCRRDDHEFKDVSHTIQYGIDCDYNYVGIQCKQCKTTFCVTYESEKD